jgi:uncharacterized BrkB/YihY/UPF0761 family membrane protein
MCWNAYDLTDPSLPRTAVIAERLAGLRRRSEALPGASIVHEAMQEERDLGGALIAGGVAFRIFLWLVPFGLVAAAVLSFWSEQDPEGLESAARDLGVGAAAAHAAAEALQSNERNIVFLFAFGLVALTWFTFGALRALVLAYAIAWHTKPPRIRQPLGAITLFNLLFVVLMASSAGIAWLREVSGTGALLSTSLAFASVTAVAVTAMWLLPHRARHPSDLLPGAALVAAGHQLVQVAVLFYFAPKLGDAEETYGAFGAAATILVWLYVISRLVTGAAFLNAALWRRRLDGNQPSAQLDQDS